VKYGWSTGSQHGKQEAAKMIRFNPNFVIMAEEDETSKMSTSGIRIEPSDKTWITWPGKHWRISTGILPNGDLR
jgi:hypothetical protein